MDEEDYTSLSYLVIGAAMEVHRTMGPGLLESIYQVCLEEELRMRGIPFLSQKRIPLIYKERVLNQDLIMDLFFPQELVVELKAVDKLLPVHEAQLLTYLKLSSTKVGLLLNFNVPIMRDGVRRMIL